MICPNCNREVAVDDSAGASVCPDCGAPLEAAAAPPQPGAPVIRGGVRCPQCGTVNSTLNAVCRNCGQSLSGLAQAAAGPAIAAEPPSLVTCGTCGAPNARDAVACRVCGAQLGVVEPTPSVAPPPVTQAPAAAVPAEVGAPAEFAGLGGLDVGPKNLGACLDRAFAIYKRAFGPLVLAAAAVNVPLAILNAVIMVTYATMNPQLVNLMSGSVSAWQDALSAMQSGNPEAIIGAFIGEQSLSSTTYALMIMSSAVAMLVPLFAYPILWGMAASLTAQAHFGRKPSGREAWVVTRRNYWPLVSVALVYGVAWFVGSSACYIGLPFVLAAIVYLVPIVIFEERGPLDALTRCFSMLSRDYWRVFLWYLGSWLTIVVMIWSLGWAITLAARGIAWLAGDESAVSAFAAAARPIAETLYVPVLMVFRTLMYFDSRARREGLDLKVALPASRPEVA